MVKGEKGTRACILVPTDLQGVVQDHVCETIIGRICKQVEQQVSQILQQIPRSQQSGQFLSPEPPGASTTHTLHQSTLDTLAQCGQPPTGHAASHASGVDLPMPPPSVDIQTVVQETGEQCNTDIPHSTRRDVQGLSGGALPCTTMAQCVSSLAREAYRRQGHDDAIGMQLGKEVSFLTSYFSGVRDLVAFAIDNGEPDPLNMSAEMLNKFFLWMHTPTVVMLSELHGMQLPTIPAGASCSPTFPLPPTPC